MAAAELRELVQLPGRPGAYIRPSVRMIRAQSMEAKSAPGWWFEPKWDGFRCLAFKDGGEVRLRELLVAMDGIFSFEALQARLQPAASRIARLAKETPTMLMLFDMLVDGQRGSAGRP